MSARYEDWAHGVAGDPATIALIDELPSPKRQPNLVFSSARYLGAPMRGYDGVPRLAPRALARRAGHRPHARDADQRGCALRAARARPRRHRGSARAARGRGIRRSLPLPRPLQLPVQRAPAARPRRRPQRGGARLRGAAGRCRCRIASPRSPGAAASTSTRSTCGVPTTSRGSMRWSGPSTTTDASASARRRRSRHPTRPASSRATSTTGWPRSPPRRRPTPPSSSSTPRCSCTSTTPGVRRFADLVRDLPGHWLSVEGRAVTPGIRVRDDVENHSTDLVLALDGVQLAWAQPHGRAIRWVPNP